MPLSFNMEPVSNDEVELESRYCFFCDGPTDRIEPHHCPITFGFEQTYTFDELQEVKKTIRKY